MEKEVEIAQRRINEREIMLLNMQQKVEEYRSSFEGERKKVVEVCRDEHSPRRSSLIPR